MVKTWSSEERADETCEKCTAGYRVTVTRYPMRDKDSFNCTVCGHLMDEWNSTESKAYTLIKRTSEQSIAP
ncbi:hypothetical protein ABIC17_000366 [Sphingomonas sp. PvP056]|jgi:hypothetical protein